MVVYSTQGLIPFTLALASTFLFQYVRRASSFNLSTKIDKRACFGAGMNKYTLCVSLAFLIDFRMLLGH
jgi:hypothetical protein